MDYDVFNGDADGICALIQLRLAEPRPDAVLVTGVKRDIQLLGHIPDEGGELMVENGKVYVDNSADGAGIICPLPHDQTSRSAGQLVMVHIR